MRDRRVGMGELKSKLPECIGDVKRGTTIVVTDHGCQVARIIPEADAADRKLAASAAGGTIIWSGRKPGPPKQKVRVRDGGTVSDIVIENRR